MKKINEIIMNFVVEYFGYVQELFHSIIEYQYRIFSYRGIFLAILLAIILGMIVWLFLRKHFEVYFDRSETINFFGYFMMIIISSHILSLYNINGIETVLEWYWKIGPFLITFFIIALIKEYLIYNKSKRKITGNFVKIFNLLACLFIFVAIYLDKFSIINDLNIIFLVILIWMILHLVIENRDRKNHMLVSEESDVEIESYDQLHPKRKYDCDQLIEILNNNNYDEPFALTIKGEWGTGKTSVINALTTKLVEKGNYRIFIKPMMLDNTEKLMKYFFSQLQNILNSNGIYTGKDSPFKKYVSLLVNSINTLSMKSILNLNTINKGFESEQEYDFRNIKLLLEKDIKDLLNTKKRNGFIKRLVNKEKSGKTNQSNKIYLIVDDMDRVEKDTLVNILMFIKEMVNFKGINVIFLMDDKKIEEDNKKINRDYMDKFINRTYVITEVGYRELFNHFIHHIEIEGIKNDYLIELVSNLKRNINQHIQAIINNFEGELQSLKNYKEELVVKEKDNSENKNYEEVENRIKEFKKIQLKLNKGLINFRKSKKIIREIKEILSIFHQASMESEFFIENIKRIDNIEAYLVRMSVMKIIFPQELDKPIESYFSGAYTYSANSGINLSNIRIAFFQDLIVDFPSEKEQLKQDILNELSHSIFYNQPISKLLLLDDIYTKTEMIQINLNKEDINLKLQNIEEIEAYLRVISMSSWYIPREKIKQWNHKLISCIFEAFKRKEITLEDLFKLLKKGQRNSLIIDRTYLEKVYLILNYEGEKYFFQDEKNKNIIYFILKDLRRDIYIRYNYLIQRILEMYPWVDSNEYNKLTTEIKEIYDIEGMANLIKRFMLVSETNYLTIFNEWLLTITEKIQDRYEGNTHIQDVFIMYKEGVKDFIGLYELLDNIAQRIEEATFEASKLYGITPNINSYGELKKSLNDFYKYIVIEENKLVEDYYGYLRTIIIMLEKYSYEIEIEQDIFGKAEELGRNLPCNEYMDLNDFENIYYFYKYKLGMAYENQKKLCTNC